MFNIIMEVPCVVLLLLCVKSVLNDPDAPVVLYPPYGATSGFGFPVMAQFPVGPGFTSQQHVQTDQHRPQPTERAEDTQNFTFNEFIQAFNDVSEPQAQPSEDQVRAAGRDEGYSYTHPSSYPYPSSPSYGPPSLYHKPAYVAPANPAPPKIPLIKPGLVDLVKPVASKVQSKVNGLLGLVLALLTGSVPEGLELKGIKELLINSILKPLLVAKSGIKSLIGKLVIPVLGLLLINVEVLVVVWWLWDECPTKTPIYKPPVEYNNSY